MHDIRRYLDILMETKLPAGKVAQLIQQYAGKVMPFSKLPANAQNAIRYREAENRDINDPSGIKPATKFGYVEIPMDALKAAVFTRVNDESNGEFADFDAYHQWYVGHGDTPSHTEVWPIYMYPEYDEVLWDGSHRFHSYVRSGVEIVPAVWDVS